MPRPPALETLSRAINRLHRGGLDLALSSMERFWEAGKLLADVRNRLQHGEWEGWVQNHCEFHVRTARRYLKLYLDQPEADLSNRTAVSVLEAGKLLIQIEEPANTSEDTSEDDDEDEETEEDEEPEEGEEDEPVDGPDEDESAYEDEWFDESIRTLRDWRRHVRENSSLYAWLIRAGFVEACEKLDETLERCAPARVCPDCLGQGCKDCLQSGYRPRGG